VTLSPVRCVGRWCALALAIAAAGCSQAQEPTWDAPSRAVVLAEVVNPDLQPFTASIGPIGEGAELIRTGAGFEPVVFRTLYEAREDAPHRIVDWPNAISRYGSLRSGALDGAQVDVYRVVGGELRRVRRGVVAEGGFHASGWRDVLRGRTMLPRAETRFMHRFARTHRPDAPVWVAVRAVSASGGLSEPSQAVKIQNTARPREPVAREKPRLIKRPRHRSGASAPPPPEGLAARAGIDGTVLLEWEPARDRDVVGYVLVQSESAPETHRGHHIDLEPTPDAAPIRIGDRIILRKTFYSPQRAALHTDRVWTSIRQTGVFRPGLVQFWPDESPDRTWRMVPHERDTPVTDPGETYLEMTLRTRATESLAVTNHAGLDQDFYPVLRTQPYSFSIWMRADRPTTATLRFIGPLESAARPVIFSVDTTWRRFEAELTPARVPQGRRPGRLTLDIEGPARVDVDNFRFHRSDADYLDLSTEDYARLARSGMTALRTHALVKTGSQTYDLDQLTNPAGAISGVRGGNTLPQLLSIMSHAGVDPWLQIEPHFTREEWLGLVEYLAAPFDPDLHDPEERPWAAKRRAQGRHAPWSDSFDRIFFELGNETWNGLMAPWTFEAMPDAATGDTHGAGAVYGMASQFMIDAMRDSPYWTAEMEEKTRFVLGGWARQPRFGLQAARTAPEAAFLTVAAYNGGWDEGEGPAGRTPESYFNILNQISQTHAPLLVEQLEEVRRFERRHDRSLTLGTYEAGPGYAHSGLNGVTLTERQAREQEEAMKSQAAAVATLDTFLFQASMGYVVQNFFTFNAGPRWSSHAPWNRGGADYAPWRILGLFNAVGPGDMLKVEIANPPRRDLAAFRRRRAVEGAPQVAAYATRAQDRLTLVALSRRVPGHPDPADDGFTPMTLSLPISGARSLTLHRMAGPHDAHDVYGQQVLIETLDLTPPRLDGPVALDAALGADRRGLPPASVLVYVFEGVEWLNEDT